MLYEELLTEGLVDRSPDKVRTSYIVWASLVFVVAVITFIAMAAILPEEVSFVSFCATGSLLVTAVFLAVIGRYMPTKTAKGAEEKDQPGQ